jgi:hypothetical protein
VAPPVEINTPAKLAGAKGKKAKRPLGNLAIAFRFFTGSRVLRPARIPERNSSGKNILEMTARILLIEKEVRARYSPPEKPKRASVKISAREQTFSPSHFGIDRRKPLVYKYLLRLKCQGSP